MSIAPQPPISETGYEGARRGVLADLWRASCPQCAARSLRAFCDPPWSQADAGACAACDEVESQPHACGLASPADRRLRLEDGL